MREGSTGLTYRIDMMNHSHTNGLLKQLMGPGSAEVQRLNRSQQLISWYCYALVREKGTGGTDWYKVDECINALPYDAVADLEVATLQCNGQKNCGQSPFTALEYGIVKPCRQTDKFASVVYPDLTDNQFYGLCPSSPYSTLAASVAFRQSKHASAVN